MSRLVQCQEDLASYTAWQASKFKWHETVVQDTSLTNLAVRVAGLLLHDFNFERGFAWRSQSSIAETLKIEVRSVRRAIAELVKAGHLSVKVSRGRGHSNECSFVAPKEASEPGSRAPEKRTPESGVPVLAASEKRTMASVKADSGVPPYLEETSNPPYPPKREAKRGQAKSPTSGLVRNAPLFLDRKVRQTFASAYGEPAAVSWLDPCRWDSVNRLVVTDSPTKRDKLRGDYRKALAEMGVGVSLDVTRFGQLPCPRFSDRIAA
ncbi:MAG: helix-turn-helix domain-containing protein [Caulobacteraceae bacterium]|nr:helix-turn-helix domain-containing protein [Caulobacteraceae bacterium]